MRCSLWLAILVSSSVASDVEFYGGRKKQRRRGLNSAVKEHAPISMGKVRYDESTETDTEFLISRDEAAPAPKIESNFGLRKGREVPLMLPDRYSVLDFDTSSNDQEDVAEKPSVEASWWGR